MSWPFFSLQGFFFFHFLASSHIITVLLKSVDSVGSERLCLPVRYLTVVGWYRRCVAEPNKDKWVPHYASWFATAVQPSGRLPLSQPLAESPGQFNLERGAVGGCNRRPWNFDRPQLDSLPVIKRSQLSFCWFFERDAPSSRWPSLGPIWSCCSLMARCCLPCCCVYVALELHWSSECFSSCLQAIWNARPWSRLLTAGSDGPSESFWVSFENFEPNHCTFLGSWWLGI